MPYLQIVPHPNPGLTPTECKQIQIQLTSSLSIGISGV
jgi:hypothetical protein